MTTARKGLATLVVVGVTGALAAFGTFSAFSDTTSNTGNSFSTGTVTLTNNSTSAMFNSVTGAVPGAPSTDRCIKVAYTGSLAATVKLYTTDSSSGTLSPYVDVTVTPGTYSGPDPAFPLCTGFTADAGGAIYSGTLAAFQSGRNGYANGVTGLAQPSTVYKFSYTLNASAPNTAQGASTGSHSYTWEARGN
jgi:predicted ribosomally synthesized peptide with SipW-like signal peptide